MATKRNIARCVVFSIITCGIYMFYWMAKMNDEAKDEAGTSEGASGVMVVLFSIITCGFYELYWYYKMGSRLKAAGDNNNVPIEDRSTIYLILGIAAYFVGLTTWINMCMMQNDLNTIADSKSMA